MPNLLTIPNEIRDEIAFYLDSLATSNLLLTCRSFATLLAPAMHHHAIAPRDHMPALHWAAREDHLPLVKYLLTIFPVDHPDANGDTALHMAAWSCNMPVTEQLLLHGAAISRTDRKGYTPFITACRIAIKRPDAAEATIRILLAHGAVVLSDASYRPLRDAIDWCSPHVARLLLDAGGSPDAKSVSGEPLILMAARRLGRVVVLKVLLEYGADVNATSNDSGTALMVAAKGGLQATVEMLVDAGAKVNLVDSLGNSAVAYACMGDHEGIVEYLVGCEGSDIEAEDLVYLTVSYGHDVALNTVLQRRAAINHPDNVSRAVVNLAVTYGREDIIRTLLKYGADIEMSEGVDG